MSWSSSWEDSWQSGQYRNEWQDSCSSWNQGSWSDHRWDKGWENWRSSGDAWPREWQEQNSYSGGGGGDAWPREWREQNKYSSGDNWPRDYDYDRRGGSRHHGSEEVERQPREMERKDVRDVRDRPRPRSHRNHSTDSEEDPSPPRRSERSSSSGTATTRQNRSRSPSRSAPRSRAQSPPADRRQHTSLPPIRERSWGWEWDNPDYRERALGQREAPQNFWDENQQDGWWEERAAPQRESPQRRRAYSADSNEAWPKGWVWKTRKGFHGWKHVEGSRNLRRSAEAKARRQARGLYRRLQNRNQGHLPRVPESTPTEEEEEEEEEVEEEVRGVEVADAESQTDLQGIKTKVREALESPGLVEALAANPKGAAKEEGDAAASSSAVKREAPPGLEEKGAEPDITSIVWPSGEVDYDPPSGLPVIALAVPATMNEMPLDAPETAEAEEAAPAASKAEDEEKTEGAADPAAEKAEEEEAAMPAAAAPKSEEAAMPPAASAEKAEEAAASSAAGDWKQQQRRQLPRKQNLQRVAPPR